MVIAMSKLGGTRYQVQFFRLQKLNEKSRTALYGVHIRSSLVLSASSAASAFLLLVLLLMLLLLLASAAAAFAVAAAAAAAATPAAAATAAATALRTAGWSCSFFPSSSNSLAKATG